MLTKWNVTREMEEEEKKEVKKKMIRILWHFGNWVHMPKSSSLVHRCLRWSGLGKTRVFA